MNERNNRSNRNKNQNRRSNTLKSNGSGHGVFLGVIIGLIIGISVAVGLVMYLNKSKIQFSNLEKLKANNNKPREKSTKHEILAPSTKFIDASQQVDKKLPPLKEMNDKANEIDKQQASTATQEQINNSNEKPEFDFYKILPGKSKAINKNEPQEQAKNTNAKSLLKDNYLQVGAFKKQLDSDNLKAKLALLGIDAKIQTAVTSTNDLIYRVKVGPYVNKDRLDSVREQLKQNGFSIINN